MSSNDPRNPTRKDRTPTSPNPTMPARPHPEQAASVQETDRRSATSATAPRPSGTASDASGGGSRTSASRSRPATSASPNAAGAQTEPGVHQAERAKGGRETGLYKSEAALQSEARQAAGNLGEGGRRRAEGEADSRLGDLYGSRQGGDSHPSVMSRLALFARERPVALLGCAMASGFLMVYLMRRSQQRHGQQTYRPTGFAQDRFASSDDTRTRSSGRSRERSTGIGLYPGDRPTY